MSNKRHRRIVGRWLAGPNVGQPGIVLDVRAGLVHGLRPDGTRVFGSPYNFQAESGESGERLLEILLPQPMAPQLFAGAIRESLAATYSTAIFGRQDTRAWEQPHTYIVDDGEGNAAVVQLVLNGLVGAVSSHDPTRRFEFHAEGVPEDQRAVLTSLLELPFLQNACSPVTGIFWTEGGWLCSPEPWFRTYLFGGEIFRSELLDEETWQVEAAEEHDLDVATASAIVGISRRAIPLQPIILAEDEVALLLPGKAKYREEAFEQLFDGGMFTRASGCRT